MKRTLGLPSVFAIATGAMFSSGFFLLPGLAADETGPALPLAYLVASIFMLPAILSMGELASAMPRSGGPYFFLTRSFGPFVGIIGVIGNYLHLLLKGTFAFVGVGAYLSLVADVSIEPVAIALIVFFTILNLIGVKQTATTEIVLVAILLLVLTYFVVAGFAEIAMEDFRVKNQFTPLFPKGVEGFLAAIALVFISYGGIGQVASVAEEIKSPSKSLPTGMLAGLAVATLFYILGTFIMVGLITSENLHDDEVPVATAAQHFSKLSLPVLAIVIAALSAFASTGNAALLSAARYPLALARDGLAWKKLGEVNQKGAPVISVLLTGVSLVILVLAFDIESIAKLGSAFLLLVFMGMCLALLIFRESRSEEYKPGFKSPFYPWTQIFGAVTYFLLIVESGLQAMAIIILIIILAGLYYRFGVVKHGHISASIFLLFDRLARGNYKTPSSKGLGTGLLSEPNLSHLLGRAIVFDLMNKKRTVEEMITKAADGLKDHLGGERSELAGQIQEKAKEWADFLQPDIAILPLLLKNIEQPEMVIVRGETTVENRKVKGLVVIADDEASSGRLLKYTSKLNEIVKHTSFSEKWNEAKDNGDIKDAFQQDIRTFNFSIKKQAPSSTLIGKRIEEVNLADNSLIILIERKGKVIVPGQHERLEEEDDITIIAEGEAVKEIEKQFEL